MTFVHAEVAEPEAFHEAVGETLLRDFVAGVVLARADKHLLQFHMSRAAGGAVLRTMFIDQRC